MDKKKIELVTVELPPRFSHIDYEAAAVIAASLLTPVSIAPGDAVLTAGVRSARIIAALSAMGWSHPKDYEILCAEENVEGAPCLDVDFNPLFKLIYRRLDDLIEEKETFLKKLTVELPFKVIRKEVMGERS